MKLLLTSAGISNKTIEIALQTLTAKPLNKLNIAFVPTASHWVGGDKSWLIKDLVQCQKIFQSVDIVDLAVLPKKDLADRLSTADILFIEGGHTGFLMHWVKKSGLDKIFPDFLKQKIYVGVSAGSIIMTSELFLKDSIVLYREKPAEWMPKRGMGLVNFNFIPHFPSPDFPELNDSNLKKLSQKLDQPIYALDDKSAILINNDEMKIVSEGDWKLFK